MGKKVINQTLLWQSIVWVQFTYANLTPLEQRARPQRPYQPDDGKILSPLIGEMRTAYNEAKLTHGKNANFDACKKRIMSENQLAHAWSEATRNFYSSVVATYITWDFRKISAATIRTLAILTPVMQYVQLQKIDSGPIDERTDIHASQTH